jgi:GDP/UDP-N,N'-diacetylbacillosamine 2-epimerase (hydrolysing)
MMAESVICCKPDKSDIIEAMKTALTDDFQEKAKHVRSPFGDGTTSKQIFDIIIYYLKNKGDTNEKHFYDIDFSL